MPPTPRDPLSPVHLEEPNNLTTGIKDEIALCLSGGGYRAMIFHLGALIRLNETGLLKRLARVSSVSGGSITAGLLGLRWRELSFNQEGVATNLVPLVIEPIQKLADRTIDARSIIGGLLTMTVSISDKVANAYDQHLFKGATLQDLPSDETGPRFVINATNVQTGALWRFSRPYMGDYKTGLIMNPRASLASAVGASSAFPPVLSPANLRVRHSDFTPDNLATLQRPPYTTDVVLTDGGVYDNLGLETAWKRCKTLLVSDGGGKMQPDPKPKRDWARHGLRINDVIDNQVRSLRKRQLIAALKEKKEHDGAYWGIRSHLADYPKPGALSCPPDRTLSLAEIPTRLAEMTRDQQERLINWGYAVCAAALDSFVPTPLPAPRASFPFPRGV